VPKCTHIESGDSPVRPVLKLDPRQERRPQGAAHAISSSRDIAAAPEHARENARSVRMPEILPIHAVTRRGFDALSTVQNGTCQFGVVRVP